MPKEDLTYIIWYYQGVSNVKLSAIVNLCCQSEMGGMITHHAMEYKVEVLKVRHRLV